MMTSRKVYPFLIGSLAITNAVAFSFRWYSRYQVSCLPTRRLATTNQDNTQSQQQRGEMSATIKPSRLLHPRNSFRGSYDMNALCKAYPPLDHHIIDCDKTNRPTIAFSDPAAVLALNTALLVADYNISPEWATLLPEESLVPPIPGRADYIHHIADLLAENGVPPTGRQVKGLDVGVGASCVYPLLGHASYGWSFLGSDIVSQSIRVAKTVVESNQWSDVIEIRQQNDPSKILIGILDKTDTLDFVMCNPPFYGSAAEFQRESRRKVLNLAENVEKRGSPVPAALDENPSAQGSNNFGGSDSELWCEGGEVGFVMKMVQESKQFRRSCLWFSSLVSRSYNLSEIEKELVREKKVRQGVRKIKLIPMGPGLKSSTIVCWSYLDDDERKQWASKRK